MECNACGDRNVEGFLVPAHRDGNHGITESEQCVGDACEFMADDQTHAVCRQELSERHSIRQKLEGNELPATLFEVAEQRQRVRVVLPRHHHLCTNGNLRDCLSRRMSGVPGQVQPLDTEGIAGPKEGSYVPEGSNVMT